MAFLASALGLAMLLDNVNADDGEKRYPKEFIDAASAFRSAATTNRYREAVALRKRLPTTPIISETFTGFTNNFAGRGSRSVVRDYDKPSYVLERSEVTRLLGTPTFTNALSVVYAVTKEPENKFDVYLSLIFYNGYVVESLIVSSAEPWTDEKNRK